MNKILKSPLIFWLGGFLLFISILSLSRKNPAINKYPKLETYEAKMQLALQYMQQGPMPMAGIKLLRKLTKEYPQRIEAPMQLGEFSMKTGQYDKASKWFATASKAASGENKIATLMHWSDALMMQQKNDSARLILMKITDYSKDSLLLRAVNQRLNELK